MHFVAAYFISRTGIKIQIPLGLNAQEKKVKFNAVAVFFEKVFQLHKLSKKNMPSLEKLCFSYESLFNSEREPTLSIYCIFKNPDCYSSRTL